MGRRVKDLGVAPFVSLSEDRKESSGSPLSQFADGEALHGTISSLFG